MQVAQELRCGLEVGDVGEKARNFDIRIFAMLHMAVELEDGLISIENAGVGLLGRAYA